MKTDPSDRALRRPFLRELFRNNGWNFLLAAISTVLLAGVNLVLSHFLAMFVDLLSGKEDALPLSTLVLLSAALIAATVLIALLSYVSAPRFYARAMRQYKDYAFLRLTEKSIAAFQREGTAAYLSALTNDAAAIETGYLEQLFQFVMDLALFAGSLTMMLLYSPLLTLAAAGFAILPLLASLLAGDRLAVAEKHVSNKNESFVSALRDSLTGFSVVKTFRAEREIFRLFSESNAAAEDAKQHKRKIAKCIGTAGSVAAITAQIGVFIAAGYLSLRDDSITPGVAVAFINLMNFIVQPIAELPSILAGRKAAFALMDKLAKAVSDNVRETGAPIPAELHDGIALHDVSFAYPGGPEVLHDVSVRFDAGKCYAVVGGSGSGKSTLLQLLLGAYSGYTGQICFDGRELSSVDSASLYALVSVVQQNVFVFNASLRDNITMFRDFPEEALREAVALSGLSALIETRGADYPAGENGANLSGGERQRISIARSLLQRAPVLLVDEATAALDRETASRVMDSILRLNGLTRVVVTHALDAALLRRCEGILAMRSGRIVERGSFDELMAAKGYFYSLYTVSQE